MTLRLISKIICLRKCIALLKEFQFVMSLKNLWSMETLFAILSYLGMRLLLPHELKLYFAVKETSSGGHSAKVLNTAFSSP